MLRLFLSVFVSLLTLPSLANAQGVRPDDKRPVHNARQLAQAGVHLYESRHLKLYTDIDPQIAKTLPGVIDQAYLAWEGYFGPLPPDRSRSVFQMTGYLMKDKAKFQRLGLIPADLPQFVNGRHRGQEFWMNEQNFDYYRRHLLIHEATHCYMTILPECKAPVWYLEGMAEWFGTHTVNAQGKYTFGVMPHNMADFEGLGRITYIQQEIAKDNFHTVQDVITLPPTAYLKNESYAWTWGLCAFFETHPDYRKRFRTLGEYMKGRSFGGMFKESFSSEADRIRTLWSAFAHQLQPGYDHSRATMTVSRCVPLGAERRVAIKADHGWKLTGVALQKGVRYRITATGKITLAQQPKPWVSEAQGISFRYFNNQPLGKLMAGIHPDGNPDAYFEVLSIGAESEFIAPVSGPLYLRVNDSWSELADNTGELSVIMNRK